MALSSTMEHAATAMPPVGSMYVSPAPSQNHFSVRMSPYAFTCEKWTVTWFSLLSRSAWQPNAEQVSSSPRKAIQISPAPPAPQFETRDSQEGQFTLRARAAVPSGPRERARSCVGVVDDGEPTATAESGMAPKK